MKKYIFVTGGVCSSLGKGIAAASIGCLLEHRGMHIRMIKVDPYINVDAGTMSPYQHGEAYVTDDGAETDLDLGNYARFTSSPLSRANSITTGQIYQEVIQKEREGRYLGRTVQVIPHITDRIKQRISSVGEEQDVDVTIVEIGGTVGDIESIPFLEACRQMIHEDGKKNVLAVHLTLIPEVFGNELKTKPTQHSVKELREIGIQPDILLCRSPRLLTDELRRKIALFTNVEFDAVISAHDIKTTIYEIPLIYQQQKLDVIALQKLELPIRELDMEKWQSIVNAFISSKDIVRIGVVGDRKSVV
jgi:CTP synthase